MTFFANLFKPNVENLKEKKDLEGLLAASRHKSPDVRRAAALSLGDLACADQEVCLFLINHLADFPADAADALRTYLPSTAIHKKLEAVLRKKSGPPYVFSNLLQLLSMVQGGTAQKILQAEILATVYFDDTQRQMFAALRSLGWLPGHDRLSAIYWLDERQFERCAETGAEAAGALVDFLRATEPAETDFSCAVQTLAALTGKDASEMAVWLREQGLSKKKAEAWLQETKKRQAEEKRTQRHAELQEKLVEFGDLDDFPTLVMAFKTARSALKPLLEEQLYAGIRARRWSMRDLAEAAVLGVPYQGVQMDAGGLLALGDAAVNGLGEILTEWSNAYLEEALQAHRGDLDEQLSVSPDLEKKLETGVNLCCELRQMAPRRYTFQSQALRLKEIGDDYNRQYDSRRYRSGGSRRLQLLLYKAKNFYQLWASLQGIPLPEDCLKPL